MDFKFKQYPYLYSIISVGLIGLPFICYASLEAEEPSHIFKQKNLVVQNEENASEKPKILGEQKDEQEHLKKAVELDPTDQDARIALANFYINHQDLQSGQEILQAVLAKDPNNVNAQAALDRLNTLKRAKDAKKEENVEIEQAYAHLKTDEFDKSQKLFDEVLAKDPQNPNAITGLGYLAAMREDREAAEQAYLKALQIDPKNSTTLEYLAVLRVQQKKIDEAKAIYAQLILLNPNVPYYKEALQKTIDQQQKAKDQQAVDEVMRLEEDHNFRIAELELLDLIRNNPQNVGYYLLIGELYLKTQRIDAAVRVFNKALRIDPNNINTLRALAEACFRRALREDAAEGEFQYQLSYPFISYATNDDLVTSKVLFEAVLVEKPDDVPSLVGLGRIAVLNCCLDIAEGYFYEALTIDPNDYAALDRLADLRIRQRNFFAARDIYLELLAIDPTDEDSRNNYDNLRQRTEPSISLTGFYIQEDENNPAVLDVSRLQTYGGILGASYPVYEGLKLSGAVVDEYIMLKNLLGKTTIYSLVVQKGSLGFSWDYSPNLNFSGGCGLSGWEKYHKQTYFVGSGLYVEPYASVTYNECHHTFIAQTLSFSEYVARDATTNHAKLLETRSVGFLYEYDLGKRRAFGLAAANEWYNDRVHNLRQVCSTWLQISPMEYWENFILRYQFEYANFTHPISDYHTYHNRTTSWLQAEFAKSWFDDNLTARLGYWHGWERGFEQTEILLVTPTAPFLYLHREINYAFGEIYGQFNEHLNTTFTGSYYHDDLHYRVWSIKGTLKWNF